VVRHERAALSRALERICAKRSYAGPAGCAVVRHVGVGEPVRDMEGIRYLAYGSAARRIQASGVILQTGQHRIFRVIWWSAMCCLPQVRGDALLLRPGIFRAPVSRPASRTRLCQRPAREQKVKPLTGARRAIASYRRSGRTEEARSEMTLTLPPIVDVCGTGRMPFESGEFRFASGRLLLCDSGSQYQACGCEV